jgi:hypothetical protein
MKISEIKSLKGLLRNAREIVDDAVNATQAIGDSPLASRIKNISKRIDDELSELERKLTTAEREEKSAGK